MNTSTVESQISLQYNDVQTYLAYLSLGLLSPKKRQPLIVLLFKEEKLVVSQKMSLVRHVFVSDGCLN